MNDLQRALHALGLTWEQVWRLTADRRTGEVIAVTLDGRKLRGRLARKNSTRMKTGQTDEHGLIPGSESA